MAGSEGKSDLKSADDQQNYAVGNSDPKNMQELTEYVSLMLLLHLSSNVLAAKDPSRNSCYSV